MDFEGLRRMFPGTDFERGMQYYHSGRVRSMSCTPLLDSIRVDCKVLGSCMYSVTFLFKSRVISNTVCSCPRYDEKGCCKHIAASIFAFLEQVDEGKIYTGDTDASAKSMLDSYLKKSQKQLTPTQTPARLVPRLTGDYYAEYPTFSFRIGYEKLYVVKSVSEFLHNVYAGETAIYGKNMALEHNIRQFDEQSQKLIQIMMDEYTRFQSLRKRNPYHSFVSTYNRNEFAFLGDSFDRVFDLYFNEPLEFANVGFLKLTQGYPQVNVKIARYRQSAQLDVQIPYDYRFFASNRSLYVMGNGELMRCTDEFREKIYPLFRTGKTSMNLALADLPTFSACVLPEISGLANVEDPDMLLQEYIPEECTVQFFFDMENDVLILNLVFAYGVRKFKFFQKPAESDGVRRNVVQENKAVAFVETCFQKSGKHYEMIGEDQIYDFLTDAIDNFRERGEVYLSDRLQNRQVRPRPTQIGVSVSGGLLQLTLNTGGFPPEELSALYQSMLQRRKYHRLADGRYLKLDGSSSEKMAEMAQMLQLSKQDLEKGAITMPAYRGLYLDAMLSGNENIRVSRDTQFRNMIRNFKTLSESDYALPEAVQGTLRPYQQTGFQWLKTLEGYGFGGILADEMGLGKTLQMIAFLATAPNQTVGMPNLVVCPASLIYNWGDEMQKFAPQLKYCLILGPAAERKALRKNGADADVWVTSYELLRQDIDDYKEHQFYCCILDEAQHIKNSATLGSKAVKNIACRQRFVLTGTPIENRLSELWNLFDFLMPGYLFTNHAFREKMEKPIVKSKNPDATLQLRRLVQPFLLRRLKSDVLKELPPKQEYVRRISLSEEEKKLYYANVQAALANLGDEDAKMRILAALTRLRQLCCDPNLCYENYEGATSKLDACAELCEAMVENGHQILLFSQFTSMLDRLRERLNAMNISNFTLQGSTSKEQRASLVKSFNGGGASVFLISLKAGGTGLNLTAADVVIHFDPWWNQAAQDQATDRAHRIGQKAHVQVYKLIAKDTIEEKILELQERKSALLDTISGGEEGGIMNMTSEELLDLLKI